jgi:hypothetical protein
MSTASARPFIFISYSHRDEPEHPRDGEVQWLSFVRTYLQPAVKHGVFDLWVDQDTQGGAEWDMEIERKLRACYILILLVSAHSMASDYIIDKELAIIRERQASGEPVHIYPLLLTPTPKAALKKVEDKNLRPRDARPFSAYSLHDRAQHMTDAANEIAEIVEKINNRTAEGPNKRRTQPTYVHITGLPETAYERLVGRDAELKHLDEAWADAKTNILSLVAEGGAGKSALVNEWLKRLQADNYRGAEAVLGWSFYSQGTKERASAAEQFLEWAMNKLGIKLATTNAIARAETIAEAMMRRRVLLLLDGIEPLRAGTMAPLRSWMSTGGPSRWCSRTGSIRPSRSWSRLSLTRPVQRSCATIACGARTRNSKPRRTILAVIRSRLVCSQASSMRPRPATCAGATASACVLPIARIHARNTPGV